MLLSVHRHFYGLERSVMSKIREIINDENSILVFDIDGVLATMEWGEYNHFAHTEE